MARYSITRTMEKTVVTCLCFDKTSAEPFNTTVTLARKVNDSKAIEKAVRKIVEADSNTKLIDVVEVSYETALMGISEQDFLANAVLLDPKTRKPFQA